MKSILLSILIILITNTFIFAAEFDWSSYSNDEIVEAIRQAENSVRFPYGIKSLRYEDRSDRSLTKEAWARMICYNSVRAGRARWIKAGRPDDLIIFIGARYCPPTAHTLNTNWVRNVKALLQKGDI